MRIHLPFKGFHESPKIKRTRKLLRYLIAVLIPVYVLLILQIPHLTFAKSSVTLLFLAGVALSAGNGGYKAGFVTTAISSVFINYFFTPPYGYYALVSIAGVSKLILFAIEGVFLSIIIDIIGKRTELHIYKDRVKELKGKIALLENENITLRREIRSRDEFLSIASHELKTPLTSMLLQTQHALHSMRNVSLAHFSIDSLLKMLETVENQTKRLSRMINDLLNVSLITTGNLNLEYEKVDLNRLVAGVLSEFAERIQKDNISLTFREEDIVDGSWDRLRIEQAVTNLVTNAIRYGNKKPIKVTLRKENGFAEIQVKDNGIGIGKNKQKKIFNLFERGVSQDTYKGLGVGLYITKQIVETHGGSVRIVSRENKGSTFTIKLPLKKPTAN